MAFLPPPLPPETLHDKPTTVMVVPAYEVQWNRPVFRAPEIQLLTKAQLWSEIPFSAHFKAKPRPRTAK